VAWPPAPVEVAWELADDDAFRRVLRRGTATALATEAHALHVELDGLPSGATFFFRFHANGETSPTGRTHTAPAPDSVAPICFLAAGCQNWEHGHFTAWRHAAAEEGIAFVFHSGDYIYEYAGRRSGQGGWGPVVRSHHGGECLSLDDYRARHAQYRTDPDLQAAHAAHPFVIAYDDHEVENNWAGPHSQRPALFPPEVFARRTAAALQAWYEHAPVRRAHRPDGTAIAAFRRLRFGATLDLHVLDTRRFRDDQPCGDGAVLPCAEVERADAQMLGPAQEAWLARNLAASGARWQVLAQQVFVAPRLLPEGRRSMDSWDGYPAARARLLDMLEARDAAILTGDVHRAWANDVAREGRIRAVEFVSTSISSEGDGSVAQPTAAGIMRENPWLRFHSNRRGYTWHEARAGRLEARFRAVPYVTRPGAPLEEAGRLVTLAGRPGLLPG
jgi:alkaline phosphatase D